MIFVWVISFVLSAWSQEQVPDPMNLSAEQLNQLGQRFVTTIKETEVDRQLTTAPAIQECINRYRITQTHIDEQTTGAQRDGAQRCFNDAFSQASASQLETLSQGLNLQSFGLVRGRGQEELRKYFAGRIQNALYGTGEAGERARLKDMKLVDHKVYHDLYKSQLGSNLLLDISRYCYDKLSPANMNPRDPGIFTTWQTLVVPRGEVPAVCTTAKSRTCIEAVTDDKARTATASSDDIYASLETALGSAATPEFMTQFLQSCIGIMHRLCDYRTMCNNQNDQTKWPQWLVSQFANNNTCSDHPTKGQAACVTQARLRDHRKNFLAMQQLEGTEGFYARTNADMNGKFLANKNSPYATGTASDADSIQGLTTPTTTEVGGALQRDSQSAVSEFDRENCVSAPENSNCDKYFYTDEQRVRFENVGLEYMAATAAEKQRINSLAAKKDDLKKYLQDKGYKDLADMVDREDANAIVAMAAARFETERQAAYAEMEKAFQAQQQPSENDGPNAGEQRKSQLQNQGRSFQELLLFNNVISSYLRVKDADTGQESRNSRVLEREVSTSGSEMGDSQRFFNNLATSEGESNQRQDGTLDLNMIDRFLSGMDQAPASGTPPTQPLR